jgi:N-methylhydantoinase B
MANFMSLEMSEHRFPLRFDYFRIRDDSGGAGWHRGGCGTEYQFTAWSDCVTTVLGDRVDFAPFGVGGGKPAAANRVEFRTAGKTWVPEMRSKYENAALSEGDGVHACSPGGGGFGDPLTRDIADVEHDLNLGYVSRKSAESDYGVVVAVATPLGDRSVYRLDAEATAAERARRLAAQSSQPSPQGATR